MSEFQRNYRLAVDQMFGEAVGRRVSDYGAQVEASVDALIRDMAKVAINEKGLHFAKGDVAELWHVGTMNLDAVQHGIAVKAIAPRDASPIDITAMGERHGVAAQLKFYRSAEDTAKAISHPKYQELEKVVPADQLDRVRETAIRLAQGNAGRPDVADSYAHTARVADDRLRIDGAESRPLTEEQSRRLTQQLRQDAEIDRTQFGLSPQQVIQWQEVVLEATSAAARAALITAALQAAPYLLAIAKKGIETGEISAEDFAPLGRALPVVLLRSGLAGGLTAAIVGAAQKELLGVSLKQLDPTLVSAAVVLCISALTNAIKAAGGELTPQEAAILTAEDAAALAVSIGLGAIGQTLIPIPVLGALIGSTVGALVGRLVIDGAKEAVLGIAVETGWTVFGLVDQSYAVPAALLKASGWQMVELRELEVKQAVLRRLELEVMQPGTIDVRVLRRGVVSFNRIGFVR